MDPGCAMGAVRIVQAAEDVDALACEEDTYLVLSADPQFREPLEHPIRIHTALREQEPVAPGSVIVREGSPLRLLAVVHDLSLDPTWREDWVALSLAGVLRETADRGLARLALPLLGAVHGRLPLARFAVLLGESLRGPLPRLRCIDVIAPRPRVPELRDLLARSLVGTAFTAPA